MFALWTITNKEQYLYVSKKFRMRCSLYTCIINQSRFGNKALTTFRKVNDHITRKLYIFFLLIFKHKLKKMNQVYIYSYPYIERLTNNDKKTWWHTLNCIVITHILLFVLQYVPWGWVLRRYTLIRHCLIRHTEYRVILAPVFSPKSNSRSKFQTVSPGLEFARTQLWYNIKDNLRHVILPWP